MTISRRDCRFCSAIRRLLATDPAELGDDRESHRVVVDVQGDGDAHAPVGRVGREMEVLDVLANDLNGNTADDEVGASQ